MKKNGNTLNRDKWMLIWVSWKFWKKKLFIKKSFKLKKLKYQTKFTVINILKNKIYSILLFKV